MMKKPTFIDIISWLSLITICLVFLSRYSKPMVTDIAVSRGTPKESELIDQQIKVSFSRPMNESSVYYAFRISPEITGNKSWANNTLFFSPKDSLKSDQTYTVTITTDAQDIYHRPLTREKTFTFSTQKANFVYLNEQNQLTIGDLGGKTKVITQDKVIKEFEVNKKAQVIVYSTQKDDKASTELYVYHIDSDKTERIASEVTGDITNIQLNAKGDTLFFFILTQYEHPITDKDGNLRNETFAMKSLNLKTGKVDEPAVAQKFPNLDYFWLTPDGNTFLISDTNSEIFLRSMLSDTTVAVGKFSEYRGGTKRGDRLLFVDASPQYNYTSGVILYNGEPHRVTSTDEAADQPSISQDGTLIAYSFIPKGSRGNFSQEGIRVISWPDEKQITNKYDANFSYELGKISPDNQYVALEEYTKAQVQDLLHLRKYGELNKPEKAVLKFLDVKTGAFIDFSIQGKELKWLE